MILPTAQPICPRLLQLPARGNAEAIDPQFLDATIGADQPGHDPVGESAGSCSRWSDFYPAVMELLQASHVTSSSVESYIEQ